MTPGHIVGIRTFYFLPNIYLIERSAHRIFVVMSKYIDFKLKPKIYILESKLE